MTRDQIARRAQGDSPLTVSLAQGDGCWTFTATLCDSEAVDVERLNQMTDAQWLETGRMFVQRRKEYARALGLIA